MSDKPIQVGDLVQVVRWPCCDKGLGRVSTVARFLGNNVGGSCTLCNGKVGDWSGVELSDGWCVPLPWLKRIPPLEELDDVKRETELTV